MQAIILSSLTFPLLLFTGATDPTVEAAAVAPNEDASSTTADVPATTKAPAEGPEASGSIDDEIDLEEWNREDWVLLKPRLSLVDLGGTFRVRGDMFRKLRFGNKSNTESAARYPTASDGRADFTSTNMRLRITPRINVSENLSLVATFDLLDNIVLGSTPTTTSAVASNTPVNILSRNQDVPQAGVNAISDSITVKRLYARITALNEQLELRIGRLPDQWGMGIYANAGDCLDCDFGNVVDRAALSFKAGGHLIALMFDWISNGPVATPFAGGQPVDAITWDDAVQYALRLSRSMHPDDVAQNLMQGETAVDYGLHAAFRTQARDLPAAYYQDLENPYVYAASTDPNNPSSGASLDELSATYGPERRDAFVSIIDTYGTLYWGGMTLQMEGVLEYGSFRDTNASEDGTTVETTRVAKFGAALAGKYQFSGAYAGTQLSLKTGGARGDPGPSSDELRSGFGMGAFQDGERGSSPSDSDLALHNFQFSPAYHVDLLLFRRIIGTVTDAWYVKPEVAYMFDDMVRGSFAAIYSQAFDKRSTPAFGGDTGSRRLGLEFDAELSYGILNTTPTTDGFKASLAGGMLFPFGAFDNPNLPVDVPQSGSFAWTIQARLYVAF